MRIEDYTEKIKNIEETLLSFLENEGSTEEYYSNLVDIIDKYEVCNDKHELALFLHFVSKISKNHHRCHNFIINLERILKTYEKEIQRNLTNSEIFKIFKGNKRILLFLLEEKIININKFIVQNLISEKFQNAYYIQYFSPEIKPFMNEDWFPKILISKLKNELPEDFYELRKEGENENYVCKLIRNDSVEDFIVYVNKNNYSLRSTIPPSIYETNSLLIKTQTCNDNNLTLIKYAAFFGSFEILKYLQLNSVNLTPQLWTFAIYSKNAQIIHLLEENLIKPICCSKKNEDENQYIECVKESIKCHHNDIVNYLLNNYFETDYIKSNNFFDQCLKSYNFSFIQNEVINEKTFFYICKYEYYSLVNLLLHIKDFDINNNSEKTALFAAVENENIEIIKLLLTSENLDLNILNTLKTVYREKQAIIKQTALHLAVEKENIEVVKLLLTNEKLDINIPCQRQNYIDKDIEEEIPILYLAVEKENIEIVKLLLANEKLDINIPCKRHNYINENIEKEIPVLHLAVEKENIEITKLLLTNEKLDINIPYKLNNKKHCEIKEPIFYLAVVKKNIEIVKLLLVNENIDINHPRVEDHTKYYMHKIEDDSKEEDFYIDYYDDYFKYEKSPLCVAVMNNDLKIINLLLSFDKLDINFISKCHDSIIGTHQNRSTALYAAVSNKNSEIVLESFSIEYFFASCSFSSLFDSIFS